MEGLCQPVQAGAESGAAEQLAERIPSVVRIAPWSDFYLLRMPLRDVMQRLKFE